ncbi:ATP-grasp domain-containing protein [Leucobacter sp. cx-169]|uniref:ATP-grasp domain-containing protein n=1 Tax=Leucobacter sp. cx-169 TaxID=2770549 RepID=UPI00165D4B20|nr:ATP-grasp domain-containing protein [Leucobacter sp. cx-169]MBC9927239.1 ATP-grasp domain-containing protein [Leucobacter sp. cx-169]
MKQLYSGDLRAYPGIPDRWSGHKREYAARVLSLLQNVTPDRDFTPDPEADIEDFWEDAVRLAASFVASRGEMDVVTGKIKWSPDELERRLGPISWDEVGGRHSRDPFIAHPLVLKYGGRAMSLATHCSEWPDDPSGERGPLDEVDTLVDWIVARNAAGVSDVVVKNAQSKSGIWVLPTSSDRAEVRACVSRALEWTAVRLDGLRDALLVQDMVDLESEVRFFVVDGEVVTAAGNVEEFTPLDMVSRPDDGLSVELGAYVDARLRVHRGHLTQGGPSEIIHAPDTMRAQFLAAKQIAAEHGGTIVLDMAMLDGSPVLVEINELTNSGLYASDPWAVARRLVTAKDRGYGQLRDNPIGGIVFRQNGCGRASLE